MTGIFGMGTSTTKRGPGTQIGFEERFFYAKH
jgi:hypothetical protein